jgi:hypothetical protein
MINRAGCFIGHLGGARAPAPLDVRRWLRLGFEPGKPTQGSPQGVVARSCSAAFQSRGHRDAGSRGGEEILALKTYLREAGFLHTTEANQGLGPPILSLYRQLKTLGTFDAIDSVIELGSQGVWCPDRKLLVGLYEAFDRPLPPEKELGVYINNTGTGLASSRHLHESLGFKYDCVDIDGNFGSITLDMNFDPAPAEYRGKYGLTTNHGTTEHVFNQYNAFKMIHDFTA